MKVFVFAILCVLIVACQAHFGGEFGAKLAANLKICKDKEGGTDADIDDIRNDKENVSEKAKCIQYCVLDKSGLILNGKFDSAAALESFKESIGETPFFEQIKGVLQKCDSITNTENCSYAYAISQCWVREGKKLKQ